MIANWTLSIISCYLACFAHRFSSYVAFFSRTSAGSLPRARARVLAGLMPQGSVLPLDLIGSEGARVFRKNCSVTTIRFAKTKIPTSVQLFCDCGLLSVLREAEMGRCVSDLSLFRASIHILTPAAIRNRKKVAILGVFLFLGTRIGLMLGAMGGVARARRLCGRLWAALCPLCSILFACRICRRSCPHPIAAPAALRYHDRNCFKRALKCILRSKQAGKGTQHTKEG